MSSGRSGAAFLSDFDEAHQAEAVYWTLRTRRAQNQGTLDTYYEQKALNVKITNVDGTMALVFPIGRLQQFRLVFAGYVDFYKSTLFGDSKEEAEHVMFVLQG